MNNDRIAEIRARCEAASKGADEVYDWRIADADLIAHAREDIPYLLEQLERTEADCDALHSEVIRLAQESVRRDATLAKLEAEVETATEARQWIPVSERLPEESLVKFLAVTKWGHIMLAQRRSWQPDWIVGGLKMKGDITHWLPLPEPPQKGD